MTALARCRCAVRAAFSGGSLSVQVAIYVSSESRFNFRQNGLPIITLTKPADNMASRFSLPHMDAVMGAARSLQEMHIPFAVANKADLARLDRYRVILLPDVLVMFHQEVHAFRDFVAGRPPVRQRALQPGVHDGRVEDFGLATRSACPTSA